MILMTILTAILAANLWVVGPWLAQAQNDFAGNAAYIGVRLVVLLVAGFGAVRWYRWPRFRAIAMVGMLGFIDQVVFKGIILARDFKASPDAWAASGVSLKQALLGTVASYVVFCPLLLLLGVIGAVTAQLVRRRLPFDPAA